MEWLERMMQSPGSFNTSIVESQENPQFPEISSSGQSTITTTAEMFSNSAKSQSISVTAMRKSCNPLLAAEQVPLKQRKSDVTGAPAASITTNDLNSKSDPGKLGLDTFELFNFVDQNDAELELRLA